jgi:hypothetical protein
LIGTKIGHYVLTCQIGEGGTGAVYLAKHYALGTYKAVKGNPSTSGVATLPS